jgi:hypothetical protein
MNRAVIEQLKATQQMLSKLLALLESSEADKFGRIATKRGSSTG